MRKRILILDDDPAVLDILQVLMDYEGYEAVVIEETNDLIGLVRLHQPALILLDFCLYGLSGGDWCVQLKNNPEFASIPVIIFTACSNKGIEKGSYGCDDFVAKPFDIDELTGRIKILTENQEIVLGDFLNLIKVKPELNTSLKQYGNR